MQTSTAVDLCRPHLATALTTVAATMCLSLGYHRESTMASDSEKDRESKSLLFWMTYILDRSFSIRLGRSSIIRDHDIQIPMVTYNSLMPDRFVPITQYWIRTGRLQGEIAEQLYCPAALQRPNDERSTRAAALATALQEAWDSREHAHDETLPSAATTTPFTKTQINTKLSQHRKTGLPNPDLHVLLFESDAIMHHSTM